MFLDAKHGESSNHTVEISFEEDVDEITKKLGPEYKFKDIVYQYGLEELDPEDQIGDVFEEGMMLTGVITNDGIEMGRKDIQNKSKAHSGILGFMTLLPTENENILVFEK